jgi:HAD superfamily hydrolase (TIGR01549 family)
VGINQKKASKVLRLPFRSSGKILPPVQLSRMDFRMTLDVTKIKALCFDVDGTLRDTDDLYVAKLERHLKPLGRLLGDHHLNRTIRRFVMTLDTPINAVYTMLDWLHLDGAMIGALEKMQEFQLRKSRAELPMIPGTRESLDKLAEKFPLSVVSARGAKGTMEFLDRHQIADRFICIASGQTTPHTKPWPDPVLWCAEQMGVLPENCLMIGDTTVDIRAGLSASAQSVGVLSGFGDQKELARAGANLIVENVAALTKIIHNTGA